jgi:hypothetical protein
MTSTIPGKEISEFYNSASPYNQVKDNDMLLLLEEGSFVPHLVKVIDVFSGRGGTAPTPQTVEFLGFNTVIQGNWGGVYGSQGYSLFGWDNNSDLISLPSYVSSLSVGGSRYQWTGNTNDVRGLPGNSLNTGTRKANTSYANPTINIDISVNDSSFHKLTLYSLDWDNQGRQFTLNLINLSTGATEATANLTDAKPGVYSSFRFKGYTRLQVIKTAGENCVISGIFFDAP